MQCQGLEIIPYTNSWRDALARRPLHLHFIQELCSENDSETFFLSFFYQLMFIPRILTHERTSSPVLRRLDLIASHGSEAPYWPLAAVFLVLCVVGFPVTCRRAASRLSSHVPTVLAEILFNEVMYELD